MKSKLFGKDYRVEMIDGTEVIINFTIHSNSRTEEREVSKNSILNILSVEEEALDILGIPNGECGVVICEREKVSFVVRMFYEYDKVNRCLNEINIQIITVWNGTDILYSDDEEVIRITA